MKDTHFQGPGLRSPRLLYPLDSDLADPAEAPRDGWGAQEPMGVGVLFCEATGTLQLVSMEAHSRNTVTHPHALCIARGEAGGH